MSWPYPRSPWNAHDDAAFDHPRRRRGDFICQKAFGAEELVCMRGPDGQGVMHAELKIGDSVFCLADEFPGALSASPKKLGGATVSIHL